MSRDQKNGGKRLDSCFVQLADMKENLSPLPLQSVDTVCSLYQSFQEGTGPSSSAGSMDRTREAAGGQAGLVAAEVRPCHKLMSATERLRKVIQELVDTEKSYVKVSPHSPVPLSPSPCFPSPACPCLRSATLDLFPPGRFTGAQLTLVIFLAFLCPSLPFPSWPLSEMLAACGFVMEENCLPGALLLRISTRLGGEGSS